MSNQDISLEVLNPRGETEKPPVYSPSTRLADLSGKRIGFYSNKKNGVDHLFTVLEKLLKDRYSGLSFIRLTGGFEIKDDEAETFASETDCIVYALGDCGACSFYGVAGVAKLEKMGKPGVFIITDTFAEAVAEAAIENAMPALRYRTVKLTELNPRRSSVEAITPVVEGLFDELVDALTIPLTEEELAASRQEDSDEADTVTVTGESYETAAEEFNRLYLENLWGDGLPMVPPTRERVQWMLSGTTRSPDEVIGKVNPKLGVATVEKIAVNAVMAGAKPEYLPVIVTIMEILTDETFDDKHVLLSPDSFTLFIGMSGPIVKEIGMEAGIGFMGQGWRPNNTIGRAIRLATLNIGQIWPGMNDMGLTGRLSPHTFFVIPENTGMSRWEPYHTGRGFTAEDSCVTVASINNSGPMEHFYGGMAGMWDADEILNTMAKSISLRDRSLFPSWGNKGVGPIPGGGQGSQHHIIILFPELVAQYAKNGYNQSSLRQAVYENSMVPYDELDERQLKGLQIALENGVIPADRKDIFESALQPGGKVPVLMSPENIHLFVSGGAPGCAFSFNYYRVPPYNKTALMTKKITGATLTKAGAI